MPSYMRTSHRENKPRIPDSTDTFVARRIIANTATHQCVHCYYADCDITHLRGHAYDVLTAAQNGTVVDPRNNYALGYAGPHSE